MAAHAEMVVPLLIHYDALMHEGDQQIVTGTLVADLSAELYSSPPTDQDSFHNIFYEDCMLRVRSDIWDKWKKVQMVIADNLFKYSTESIDSGNTELHFEHVRAKMLKTKPNENHMFEAIRCQLSVVDGRTYTTTCMRYQIVQYLQNDGHHLIAKITELLEKRNMDGSGLLRFNGKKENIRVRGLPVGSRLNPGQSNIGYS